MESSWLEALRSAGPQREGSQGTPETPGRHLGGHLEDTWRTPGRHLGARALVQIQLVVLLGSNQSQLAKWLQPVACLFESAQPARLSNVQNLVLVADCEGVIRYKSIRTRRRGPAHHHSSSILGLVSQHQQLPPRVGRFMGFE